MATQPSKASNHEEQQQLSTLKEETRKPYSFYNHPFKNWTDLMIDLVLWLVGGLPKLYAKPPKESLEVVHSFRKRFEQTLGMTKSQLLKWEKLYNENNKGSPIAICEYKLFVERSISILSDWGLIDKEKNTIYQKLFEQETTEKNATTPVHLFFPTSLIQTHSYSTERNQIGCVSILKENDKVENDESDNKNVLQSIPSHVPILLWLHGGGQVLGMAQDDFGTARVSGLLQELLSSSGDSKESSSDTGVLLPPMVVASIDYALAPDRPFPSSVVDTMSAIQYFQENFPNNPLHIAAASGGSYPAVLATLGNYRARHNDRAPQSNTIKSCALFHPMLNPACDSESGFMNSTTSNGCPVEFIIWCWQGVLGLEAQTTTSKDSEGPNNWGKQTRESWQNSQWYRDEEWRCIADPIHNIPKNVANETKFLIYTSRADPLHDDGVHFVKYLKENQNDNRVYHVDGNGNHGFSTVSHPQDVNAFTKEWEKAFLAP